MTHLEQQHHSKKRKKYVLVKIRGKKTYDGGTWGAFLGQPRKLIFHI
jgi:hypothetical protein